MRSLLNALLLLSTAEDVALTLPAPCCNPIKTAAPGGCPPPARCFLALQCSSSATRGHTLWCRAPTCGNSIFILATFGPSFSWAAAAPHGQRPSSTATPSLPPRSDCTPAYDLPTADKNLFAAESRRCFVLRPIASADGGAASGAASLGGWFLVGLCAPRRHGLLNGKCC